MNCTRYIDYKVSGYMQCGWIYVSAAKCDQNAHPILQSFVCKMKESDTTNLKKTFLQFLPLIKMLAPLTVKRPVFCLYQIGDLL